MTRPKPDYIEGFMVAGVIVVIGLSIPWILKVMFDYLFWVADR